MRHITYMWCKGNVLVLVCQSVSSTIQILNISSGKLSLHCNNVAAVLHNFMIYMMAYLHFMVC